MSKKDLIEQNITRVQEYVRELIEDAKWNNGVSETLESTSIIVGNSDDIYDFAILFASNSECVYCEFIDSKIEYIDCELDCEICQFEGRIIFQYINGKFHNPASQIIELSKLLMKGELRDTKSIFCSMVLRLMDTEEYSNNYCTSLDLVLRLFPEIDGELLEKELDRYI